jgi:hypothetical protein
VELTIGHGSNITVIGLLLIAIAGLVVAIGIIRLSRYWLYFSLGALRSRTDEEHSCPKFELHPILPLYVPFDFVSDIMVSIPGPGDTVMDRDHIARIPT